ncbi:MAG TPA: hypothetical protein VF334_05550 [Polyangia bacterium]
MESHDDLKGDRDRWAAEIDLIGEIEMGDGRIVVLANCRTCHSTLAIDRERAAIRR